MEHSTFSFENKTFYWFPKDHTVMATDGCTITEFESIDDFEFAAIDAGGSEMLSGWEY